MATKTIDENHGPLYPYKVDTVGNLLLCLKPHTLRQIRNEIMAIESRGDFAQEDGPRASATIELIDSILDGLDGEA